MDAPDILLVFVRHPQLGRVKTRLAAEIGPEAALRVYERLLAHTQATVRGWGGRAVIFYADLVPDTDGWDGFPKKPQHPAADLGLRMQSAFELIFQENPSARVVIIGSDCPALRPAHLRQAFAELSCHQAVIGPAADGGYYLLGLQQPDMLTFMGKHWSSSEVFAQTVADWQRRNRSYFVGPVLTDLDRAADLPPGWLPQVFPEKNED